VLLAQNALHTISVDDSDSPTVASTRRRRATVTTAVQFCDASRATVTSTTQLCDSAATEGIRVNAVIAALRLIMEQNVFCFRDTFWRQLSGTPMGTPPAPMYATLYFAIHEERIIHRFPQLKFYRRYIDDSFGIWVGGTSKEDTLAWREFQRKFASFGRLSWTFSPLQPQIDFLDITIGLDSAGRIKTSLFEKALNLYLYLPPHSAHPPGALKGLIFGWFYRLERLVSCRDEREQLTGKLRARLWARGYPVEQLEPLFAEARSRCFQQTTSTTAGQKPESRPLYLHVQYHPADPSARTIQKLVHKLLLAPRGESPLEKTEKPCWL
jgi:hypothetical protein